MPEQNIATLTGLAIGDSLGMPFETHHFTSNTLMLWEGGFCSGATNAICTHLQPGQWTDDTKMSMALAESLLEVQGYSAANAAQKYLNWFQSNDLRGIGTTTGTALRRLESGASYEESGVFGAEGNGTAMRASPIGLFFKDRLDFAATIARADARITHASVEAEEGSVAVTIAVALLANGAPKTGLLTKVLPFLAMRSTVRTRLIEVVTVLSKSLSEAEVLKYLIDFGTGAHVVQTIPAAFLAFLACPNFTSSVEAAVRAGGDTDTTASIVGALAGTHYGISQLQPYLEQLEGASKLRLLEMSLLEGPK